jgi:hypothetical protein
MIYKFEEPGVNETILEFQVVDGDDWDFGNRKILLVTLTSRGDYTEHMMCKSEVLALKKALDLIIQELGNE